MRTKTLCFLLVVGFMFTTMFGWADTVNQPTSFQIASATQPASADYGKKEQTPVDNTSASPAPVSENAVVPLFVKNASKEEVEVPLATRKLLLAGRCCGIDPNLYLRSAFSIIETQKGYYNEQKLESTRKFALLIMGLNAMGVNLDNYSTLFVKNAQDQLSEVEREIAVNATKIWFQQRIQTLNKETEAIESNIKILDADKTLPREEATDGQSGTDSK